MIEWLEIEANFKATGDAGGGPVTASEKMLTKSAAYNSMAIYEQKKMHKLVW